MHAHGGGIADGLRDEHGEIRLQPELRIEYLIERDPTLRHIEQDPRHCGAGVVGDRGRIELPDQAVLVQCGEHPSDKGLGVVPDGLAQHPERVRRI